MDIKKLKPWGRNSEEYCRMFGLDISQYDSILSVADGPSSFQAENPVKQIISVDPLYEFSSQEIESEIKRIEPNMLSYLQEKKNQYDWSLFENPKELVAHRLRTMNNFLTHYRQKPSNYLPQHLPNISLNQSFDIALCSHFLFLFEDELDLDFHKRSIQNILNHSPELRIYPLVKADGESSSILTPLIKWCEKVGIRAETRKSNYLFQKKADKYLSIKKGI